MRRAAGVLVACALVVTGCSAQVSRQGPDVPAGAGADPSASPSDPSSAPVAPIGEPSDGPAPGGGPDPAGDPDAGEPGDDRARTDVPDAAVLPAQRAVDDAVGAVAWSLPPGCSGGVPGAASTVRTVVDGDGRPGTVVRTQQVAAFPDTPAAVSEAARLAEVMDRCAADGPGDPDRLRSARALAVGAQGHVLTSRRADGATGPGGATVVTRRGNALTVVARSGGEVSVEAARRTVVDEAQQAWERLCLYDRTAGCPPG